MDFCPCCMGAATMRLGPVAVETEDLESGRPSIFLEPVGQTIASDVHAMLLHSHSLSHADRSAMGRPIVFYVVKAKENHLAFAAARARWMIAAISSQSFKAYARIATLLSSQESVSVIETPFAHVVFMA